MDERTAKRWHDAHVACDELIGLTTGMSFQEFLQNRTLQLAVQRLLEIVGEAFGQAMRHDPWVAEAFPDAYVIVGLRNRIIHGYDQVRDDVIWDTVGKDIPNLHSQLGDVLPQLPETDPSSGQP